MLSNVHKPDATGTVRRDIRVVIMLSNVHQPDATGTVRRDIRVVIMLSNVHQPDATGTVRRRVECAAECSSSPLYQQHMNLCDQMIGYYQPELRSKKL